LVNGKVGIEMAILPLKKEKLVVSGLNKKSV